MFKLLESDGIEIPLNCYELALHAARRTKDFPFGIRVLRKMFESPTSQPPIRQSGSTDRQQSLQDFPEESVIPGLVLDRTGILHFIREARQHKQDAVSLRYSI